MVSQGFVGCTLGCLAGGGIEPNAAMLCLFSCYLVESRGGDADDRNADVDEDALDGGENDADHSGTPTEAGDPDET
jgi:hypothetical protein